jgi:hypothetical protein
VDRPPVPEMTRSRENVSFVSIPFCQPGRIGPLQYPGEPRFPDRNGACMHPHQPRGRGFWGTGVGANGPDDWQLTFHWETTGGPAAGIWEIDAFLESVGSTTQLPGTTPEAISPGVANMTVPGFPLFVPGVVPQHYNQVAVVPSGAMGLPPGVHLFRLFTTLRWNFGAGPVVRVAGRAEGPLIEFYHPV